MKKASYIVYDDQRPLFLQVLLFYPDYGGILADTSCDDNVTVIVEVAVVP